MLKVKTAALTGPALDYAVGLAQGLQLDILPAEYGTGHRVFAGGERYTRYRPTIDWAQCGPLLEQYAVTMGRQPFDSRQWAYAFDKIQKRYVSGTAQTYQAAICLAVVAVCLGDEVEIPEVLL